MARVHFFHHLQDKEGRPIENANIAIYVAGTTTPLYVYYDEYGSSASNAIPQLITNALGFFEFWIGDESEQFGYARNLKIKIAWDKPGIANGYVDYVDTFPNILPVNENDNISTGKDKLVSNQLAYLWTRMSNWDVRTNGLPFHGIESVNPSSRDTTTNKLISNFLANEWSDHISNTSRDDHLFYVHRDGRRGFTNPVVGVSPTLPSHLATLQSVINAIESSFSSQKLEFSVSELDWVDNGDGTYYIEITHGLGSDYPLVQVWDSATKKVVAPYEIESTSSNKIKIFSLDTLSKVVRISF
jgi:hypothetical protein